MSSRKSKASQKSRKVKSKSRKSKASQKSRQSRKQASRLKREIQLSNEMSKRMSKKTPMIASSHGISLLKRSKRNMSKGKPLASARDFLLATSILTAALSPYDPHPMAKKSQIAPDTQVHLDWHKGQFPDKQLTSKQYKKLMKREKRLATIKEGGRKWSLKYKRKINCKRPKGFSQKQYCKRISKKKKKSSTKKNRKKRTKKSRKMRGGQRVLNWISVPHGLVTTINDNPNRKYKLVYRDADDKDFGYDIRRSKREIIGPVEMRKDSKRFDFTAHWGKGKFMQLNVAKSFMPAYLEDANTGDEYLIVPADNSSEEYNENIQNKKVANEK
tara:strand:+ start:6140 stop:7126 length:987 start_codon:yes stop_codon:yes gene_type:complete